MKIYSWNIWFTNKHLDTAFTFIQELDFDILCLQEVPEPFLARLKTLPYSLHAAPEVDRALRGGAKETHYIVILSKHPVHNTGVIDLPHWELAMPLRSRLFVDLMVGVGLWSWGLGNRHAIYADIQTTHSLVRVFNLHLVLMHPRLRLIELETSLGERLPSVPTIVAGDFNIVESPKVSILNWLLGGRVSDALLYSRERTVVEKRFAMHELTNTLRGKSTHPISRSQLDHILVSNSFRISAAEVLPDRHGSDHNPIFVECISR